MFVGKVLPIILFILLVGLGAGGVYLFARTTPQIVVDYTPTPTSTQTSTVTLTPTATSTSTPQPTATQDLQARMKTAKVLGLDIPNTLIGRADDLIE